MNFQVGTTYQTNIKLVDSLRLSRTTLNNRGNEIRKNTLSERIQT